MSISFHKIKKWTNMLLGKSVYHVLQDEGKVYSKTEIKGYYNNLTEKVSRFGFDDDQIPATVVDSGEKVYFSIAIFQYGLGAYDLYLLNNDESMLKKALACANWAVENQQSDGGWLSFQFENPEHPYSSMAQGEGISLLCRLYNETKNELYLSAIKKAMDFMLLPIGDGGTAEYDGEDVYFYEYTYEPLILNGWIFSYWGLRDYVLLLNDEKIDKIACATLKTMIKTLPQYDIGYWSRYDLTKRIASPFYHELHIAQLNVMYDLTGEESFALYSKKWQKYSKSYVYRIKAFVKKAWQKITE